MREESLSKGFKKFYSNKLLLRDKKLGKNTKKKIYKIVIRSVMTYAAETAHITLKVFKEKMIKTIMGPVKVSEYKFRRLVSREVENILNKQNIVRIVKSQFLRKYIAYNILSSCKFNLSN